MRSPFLLLLALPLTCTGVLVTGCSGAETQDVLAATASTEGTGDDDDDDDKGTTKPDAGGTIPQDCTPEEEPNDKQGDANKLSPERCGTLSNEDQKDFLTFRLKPTTKNMSVTLTGRVRLRISVKGEPTTELTPDTSAKIPFVYDADYFIEVTALNSGKTVPWRVGLQEE